MSCKQRSVSIQKLLRYTRTCISVLCLSCVINTDTFALDADVAVTRFRTMDKAYAEIFIYVLGSSVTSRMDSNRHFASVSVAYFISQGNEVIAGDKYNLISTGVSGLSDFMDLKRHFLNPGKYEVLIELTDNLDSTNFVKLSKPFTIAPAATTLEQSDIQLLSHVEPAQEESVWVRNGMRMMPLPYAWYREDLTKVFFYQEIYHSDQHPGDDYYISYTVVPDYDSSKVLLQGFKRMKPQQINTVTQALDISGLSSGEYVLHIGAYDQSQKLLSASSSVFYRTNPEIDQQLAEYGESLFENSFTLNMQKDSLRYALKAIAPVISQSHVPVLNWLLQKGDPENQRRFLHQYWVEINTQKPEQAYAEFMAFAHVVDKEYHAAFGYGFETDRGRIMLKYGIPNDVVSVTDEPSAPPYEIWIYHSFPVTNQSNVRFLFYNPSLAGGDFRLLHSTAVGELQNRRWQHELYRDALSEPAGGDFIDGKEVGDNFHRRAAEYFND